MAKRDLPIFKTSYQSTGQPRNRYWRYKGWTPKEKEPTEASFLPFHARFWRCTFWKTNRWKIVQFLRWKYIQSFMYGVGMSVISATSLFMYGLKNQYTLKNKLARHPKTLIVESHNFSHPVCWQCNLSCVQNRGLFVWYRGWHPT